MGVRTIAYPPSTASKQQLAAISPSASLLSSQSGIVAGSRQRSVRSSPTASLLCSRRNEATPTKTRLGDAVETFIRREDAERFNDGLN